MRLKKGCNLLPFGAAGEEEGGGLRASTRAPGAAQGAGGLSVDVLSLDDESEENWRAPGRIRSCCSCSS